MRWEEIVPKIEIVISSNRIRKSSTWTVYHFLPKWNKIFKLCRSTPNHSRLWTHSAVRWSALLDLLTQPGGRHSITYSHLSKAGMINRASISSRVEDFHKVVSRLGERFTVVEPISHAVLQHQHINKMQYCLGGEANTYCSILRCPILWRNNNPNSKQRIGGVWTSRINKNKFSKAHSTDNFDAGMQAQA